MLLQVTDKIINNPNSSIQSFCIKSQEFRFANGQKKKQLKARLLIGEMYTSRYFMRIYIPRV